MIKKSDIEYDARQDYEETLNQLDSRYGYNNCTQKDIEQIVNERLASLPKLDRNKLRNEMQQMHVEIYTDPTTFNINEGLAQAQAYRERLAGILTLAEREYNTRSKMLDMLIMTNNVASKASSADKRKGEALMKYPMQFIHLEAAETFRDEVKTYLTNMQSTSESISRQVSVLQAQIALGERRRPDDNFSQNIRASSAINKPIEEFSWNS